MTMTLILHVSFPVGIKHDHCHWWGRFLPGVMLLQNKPISTGRPLLTNYGRTSAITSRQQPANAFSMSKQLIIDRRLLVVNNFLTSKLLVNTRRLLFATAFWTSASNSNNGWPNTLPWHKAWRQHMPSSCGFDAAPSTPGSLD